MAILYLAECCICTLSTPHLLRRLNSIVIVGNSEPRTAHGWLYLAPCRSARGLPLGQVWGRVVAWAACAGSRCSPESSESKTLANHGQVRCLAGRVAICIYRWKCPRMRRRRLYMYFSDPRRPRGDLRTTNRHDSIDAPAMVASSISRIKKINFFGPQYLSH